VRRSDLQATDSSRESSIDLDAIERLRSGNFFSTEAAGPESAGALQTQIHIDHDEPEGEEVAFRLFAPTAAGGSSRNAQVIRLRSPTPEEREPGFLRTRSDKYYLTGPLPEYLQREYDVAAVTADDVRSQAKIHWPGSAYSWKTIRIPPSQAKQALVNAEQFPRLVPQNDEKKRTRLGKKGRIKKRQKTTLRAMKKEEEAKAKEVKELAEREKRARRNREKKFKKRARDKAKKSATAAEGGSNDTVEQGEDDGDSSGE